MRKIYLDNIRWCTIILVVLLTAAFLNFKNKEENHEIYKSDERKY